MSRRIVVASLVLLVGHSLLSAGAAAQSCVGQLVTEDYSYFPAPIPAGWFFISLGAGPWFVEIGSYTAGCPAPPSWCPTCGKGQAAASSPINLSNGNTYIQQMDIRVPGLGNGLTLQRTWNSIWPSTITAFQTGMFGLGWRSTYEERVFQSSNYIMYLRGDGGFWVFGNSNGSTWKLQSPASVIATLTQNGTQSWTLAFQNGEKRTFDYTSGSLTAIADPNGNTTQLTYDGTHRLVTVTDPANRHLYFTYGNGSNNLLVTSVTSDAAPSWSYSYDSQNRLTLVTRPDQTTNSFVYNSQSLISQVLDSGGQVLESHTYDANNRSLTSSRAGGVESVTVSYPQ